MIVLAIHIVKKYQKIEKYLILKFRYTENTQTLIFTNILQVNCVYQKICFSPPSCSQRLESVSEYHFKYLSANKGCKGSVNFIYKEQNTRDFLVQNRITLYFKKKVTFAFCLFSPHVKAKYKSSDTLIYRYMLIISVERLLEITVSDKTTNSHLYILKFIGYKMKINTKYI